MPIREPVTVVRRMDYADGPDLGHVISTEGGSVTPKPHSKSGDDSPPRVIGMLFPRRWGNLTSIKSRNFMYVVN